MKTMIMVARRRLPASYRVALERQSRRLHSARLVRGVGGVKYALMPSHRRPQGGWAGRRPGEAGQPAITLRGYGGSRWLLSVRGSLAHVPLRRPDE